MSGELFILREEDGTESTVDREPFDNSVYRQVAELQVMHSETGNDFAQIVGAELSHVHARHTPAYARLWAASVVQVCCTYMMTAATTFSLSWLSENLTAFCVVYRILRPVVEDGVNAGSITDARDTIADDGETYQRAVETVQKLIAADEKGATEQMQFAKVEAPETFDSYAVAAASLVARFVLDRAEPDTISDILQRYRSLIFTYRGLR